MNERSLFLNAAVAAGCPEDQTRNFVAAQLWLHARQLAASAAARLCDHPDGPTAIGYGGARGGGKSHWLLAQLGADDCQRVPGLKCLLLRKVGKANLEHFEDLRRKLFNRLPHEFSAYRGILTFANGSRIIAGHFQNESDIDAYLGLEYDAIGIEEATTLTARKYQDITTCCRSSKTFVPPTLGASQPSTLNSQPTHWRPRIYSTTNPGGIGHAWYKKLFIQPYLESRSSLTSLPSVNSAERSSIRSATSTRSKDPLNNPAPLNSLADVASAEADQPSTLRPTERLSTLNTQLSTVFVPARVTDNAFNNPEYRKVLESLNGWQRRAWLDGDWDLAAGQFFTTFRRDVHVVADFDETRACEWFAALDYGFAHYTVILLGCTDGDGNVFVVDEHAERLWLPQRHAAAIKAMLARHRVPISSSSSFSSSSSSDPSDPSDAAGAPSQHVSLSACQHFSLNSQPLTLNHLSRFVAGADVFSRQSDGTTIAQQYGREGIRLRPANMDRVNGWAEILQLLGDPQALQENSTTLNSQPSTLNSLRPRLFIHQRCGRLAETLPAMQHDPNRPEDVLKVDADEDGVGGDDAADCLRYLVATKARTVEQRKLRGL